MGRPTLARNRKTRRAAHEIDLIYPGLGELIVRGGLELLWEPAYESGDPYVGDADDIERTVGWPGPPGAFCQALLSAGGQGRAGFIEPAEGGGYLIHDFWHHAPDYVRKRRTREHQRRARDAELSRTGQRPDADQTVTGQCPPSSDSQDGDGRTPSPSPSPKKKKILGQKQVLVGFEEFWKAYPRHIKRKTAEEAWAKLAPDSALLATMLAALKWQRGQLDWQKENGRFIPHPASWINGRRWEDEREVSPNLRQDGNGYGAPAPNSVVRQLRRLEAEIAGEQAVPASEGVGR